jgi:ribosomal RNA-processing protein 9
MVDENTFGVAHGVYDPLEKEDEGERDEEETKIPPHPRWITALGSLRYSDLFASGSYDGTIRLWKLSTSSKKNTESQLSTFTLLSTISCPGVINSLQFVTPEEGFWAGAQWAFSEARSLNSIEAKQTSENNATGPRKRNADARPILLIASIGQEHRFGRWVSVKRQMAEVSSPFVQDGDVLMDAVEANGTGSSRKEGVQMKQVAIRNGATVFALFPKGFRNDKVG